MNRVDEIGNGIQVFKTMKRIMHNVRNAMGQQFKDFNITGPQGMLIGTLMHHDTMKISDLSDTLGLSNSTVSGILDRLEKQGLVERTRSKDDRRVVYVSITPEFRKNAKEKYKALEETFQSMLSKATPEENEMIQKGLETLEKVMQRSEILRRRCDND